MRGIRILRRSLRRLHLYFAVLALSLLPSHLSAQAQTPLRIITWYQNTPDWNAMLGVTSIRLGCSATPDFCLTEMDQVASSQDVQQIYLSIKLDPPTAATYARQFSQGSLTHPVLFAVGFDDLVGRMGDLQGMGITQPGTVVTDTINATKSVNANLKFAVTMYEDQLGSPLLTDSNLPASTRANVDYVELYIHYRADAPNYPTYVQQVKTLFPNAKIIAGAYAYDRIDYLPCTPHGVPCTTQQEENLFQQLFLIQLEELKQGIVDQIEFFFGYFGIEAQWPAWSGRRCAPTRVPTCIANTVAMRQTVLQDLSSAFGPPGPLTSLSPRPLDFPVQDVSTTSGASSITLNNPGSAPLSIGSIAIAGGNGSDFSQQNSCPATLAANSQCSINVTFSPTAVGTRTSQLVVTDNSRRSPHFLDLSGLGANSSGPQDLLSPTALDFNAEPVGQTSPSLSILLTNTGQGTLNIASIAITGTNGPQFVQTNNCGTTIAPAGTCTINVTFTPAAADNEAAQLLVTDNAVGSPHTIPMIGLGNDVTAAQVLLSKSALSFNSQSVNTSSAAQSATLSNPGTAAVVITQVSITGTNAVDFSQTNTCGSGLATAKSCTLSVTFKPSGAGPRSARLLIADNANLSPQSVNLNGTGAPNTNPLATVSPASLTFSSQTIKTTSSAMPVVLNNTGSAALALSSIAISGADAADFAETNTCGNAVAAGGSCTVQVSFSPSTAGARSASLQIKDDAAGSPQTVPLLGTGTAVATPILTLTPSSLNFGDQSVGATGPALAVTVENTGNSGSITSGIAVSGVNAADFAETNTCMGTVAAGSSCSISVAFTPAQAGSRSAQIAITDNSSGSPHQIALSGTGTSVSSSDFAVTATPMSASVTSGNSATFTLSVSGSAGFNQSVTFACSPLPAGASCNFSPSSVTPGTSSAKTTLTIATVKSGSLFGLPQTRLPWFRQMSLRIFAICLLLYPFWMRRTIRIEKWPRLIPRVAAVVFLAAVLLTGCGIASSSGPGSGSTGGTSAGTPAGTYSVSVTASSQTLSHQVNLSLTVK